MANEMDNSSKLESVSLLPKRTERKRATSCRKLLILIASMYLHFMSLGLAFCLGVVYVELLRYFDTDKSLAVLVQSCYQGLTFVGGLLFSSVVTKYGVAVPVLIASVLGSGFLFISAWSVNIYMVIMCVGVMGGLCMSVNYLCAFVSVGWTYKEHRRAAIAFLTLATAVGQTVLPTVVEKLMEIYGWQGTLIISSGLMLNSVPCGVILLVSKRYFSKNEDTTKRDKRFCECKSRRDIAFIIFLSICVLSFGAGAVEAWFLVDLATSRGISRQSGTLLLSLMGACGLLGRAMGTVFLKLCPTVNTAMPVSGAILAFAASHIIIITLTEYAAMVGGVVLRGVSGGFAIALQQVLILDLRGIDRFPKAVATFNFLIGISQVACSYLLGLISDVTGAYNLAFYIAAAGSIVCGIGLVVIWCLVREQ